ncbi:MAG: nucleotide pyrophosphohydrolase [Bacteroidia bacterium]
MDFKEIEQKVIAFRNERNWEQFHQVKDLLLGLNIEVAELQELFLWKTEEQQTLIDQEKIKDELADIAIFLIYICKHYSIDLPEAISQKLDKNAIKYPADKSRNSNKKYNEL